MLDSKKLNSGYSTSPAVRYGCNRPSTTLMLVVGGIISVFVFSSLLYGEVCWKWLGPAIQVGLSVVPYMVLDRQHAPTGSANATLPATLESADDPFNWKKIKPSAVLEWVDCYPGAQCARLEVPLDYSDPEGDKAAVALVRVKAKVLHQNPAYRGPVLINPGAPGGSGVMFIRELGERYQQLLSGEYDIIGFDPRGVGETTPAISIFPDQVERSNWGAGTPPLPNSTADALSQGFFRAVLFNELVEVRSKRAAQYASTAVVARDMLSIIKAHGRDRLQYWGFSYGTVLGATYAAMFPDNIERLVIDGVADFDDYYSGSWSKNLLNTDNVLHYFYDHCAKVGSACPLHANSSALVKERVESIFAKVKANPVAVINGTEYGLIDYRALKTSLFMAFYQPFTLLPRFSHALAALETGDGRQALAIWKSLQPTAKCNTPPLLFSIDRKEAQLSVRCGEAKGVHNTLEDLADFFENQHNISVFADIWTDTVRTSCAGWRVHQKERFAGPFTANTSFPLLIIGNTADPVTPLAGARKAARGFESSALLTVDTPGHTSFAATSICVNKLIRNYFIDGQLPQEGTVCDGEDVLFGEKQPIPESMSMKDAELLKVSRSLSNDFHSLRGLSLL